MVRSVPGARGTDFVEDAWFNAAMLSFDFRQILSPSIGILRRFIYVTKPRKRV